MTLNYFNFVSICNIFFFYLEASNSSFHQTTLERITKKWNLWLRTHAAVNTIQTILVGTGHCWILFHLTSSRLNPTHPSSPICLSHTPSLLFWAGLRQWLRAKTCLRLLKRMTDTHTHARTQKQGRAGWGPLDVARFPKQCTDTHTHTQRHKHVKTGPLAMETCRGTSER